MQKSLTEGYFIVKNGHAGSAFQRQEFILPQLTEGQVRIHVEAFGLNFADIMARRGKYKEAPNIPFVPGYDVVGEIIAISEELPSTWIGKRVAGFTRFGGYAKQVQTTIDAVVEIGDMPTGEALALCTQGVTASYMISFLPKHTVGQFALVHAAAGGVGSLVLQLLHQKGIKTIAKVSSESKKSILETLSPFHILVSNNEEYDDKLSKEMVDIRWVASFNAIGGKTIKKDLKRIDNGGLLFLFGGASLLNGKWGIFSLLNFIRKTGFLTPIQLMMQSKGILGVNMLKLADNHPEVLKHHLNLCFTNYQKGKLRPLKPLGFHHEKLVEAHHLLESGNSTGKIFVYWDALPC